MDKAVQNFAIFGLATLCFLAAYGICQFISDIYYLATWPGLSH